MRALEKLVNELEAKIPHFEKINPSISNTNIGWHIDHSLMVLNGIIDTTSKSDPKKYKWKFNYKRFVVLFQKKIPRGKAKAPKSVQPIGDYNMESLKKKISIAKLKLDELSKLPNNKYFEHPGLGHMRLKQAIKFLEIHTSHHLRIVEEIDLNEE